jgi:hypothetical protein
MNNIIDICVDWYGNDDFIMTMLSHPDYAVEDITLVDGNVVILHFL